MKMETLSFAAAYHRQRRLVEVVTTPLIIVFLFAALSISGRVEGYENYTVGDSLGWYDPLKNPNVDYQKWADSNDYTLGDFLIFNTDNNNSVIQTYNPTTYNLCNYNDAVENDTTEWSSANPSSTTVYPVSVAVPLTKVGPNYFFSSNYDGEQCKNGQHFKINVTYGQGLPPSLRSPSDNDSPAPVSPDSGDDESVPDITVPPSYNFDNPRDVSDDNGAQPSGSVSLFQFSMFFGVHLYGFLTLVGLICYVS